MNHIGQKILRAIASVLMLTLALTGTAGAKETNSLSSVENFSAYQEPVQAIDLPYFDGSYYQLVDAYAISWEDANTSAKMAVLDGCESAHLVTITSQEEQDALNFFFGDYTSNRWLGGYQEDGQMDPAAGWHWVTGEPWEYTNWAVGQPDDYYGSVNEQYLVGYYYFRDGIFYTGWADRQNDPSYWWHYGYIIEYDFCQPPPPTGLPFFDGSYYQSINTYSTPGWKNANMYANAAVLEGCKYAHLVTITSQDEQDALYLFFGDGLENKWYGGYQEEGEMDPLAGWKWVTGEPWEYTHWSEEEPNDGGEPGTEQYLAGGNWWSDNSMENGYISGYIIEYEQCAKTPFVTGGGWINTSPYTGLFPFNGHYYEIVSGWPIANAVANAAVLEGCEYAHLVTITSQEEQDALYGFFDYGLESKWFGGYQDEGELVADANWHWVTGEPWEYSSWSGGEPNDAGGPGSEQHLAGAYFGGWNDEGYSENVNGYVIEYEQCISSVSTDFPYFNGHYYQLVETAGPTWTDANSFASAAVLQGCEYAHLVTIDSLEEQDALYSFFGDTLNNNFYGGYQNENEMDPASGWQWVTGEPWEFTNWAEGEPNDAYEPGMEQYLAGMWGGGWNDVSTAGGYVIEYEQCGPTGRAEFDFVSRFAKGATDPTGYAEFQFEVADLSFQSSNYNWLWIKGGNYALVHGVGTLDGEGEYRFMIWAGDGTGPGGADTFRIKIWEESENGIETIIFDNLSDQTISHGSINVHVQK